MKICVIGCGGRSKYIVENLLKDSDRKVQIVAVFDPDKAEAEAALKKWASPDATICDSYEAAIEADGVQWVVVASPNVFHKAHILAAFARGKNVFSEKPLATTIEDCKEIYDAHRASGLVFATGFVLRYSPTYRKAKEILASGILGKLVSIDANENLSTAHGGYIMSNWRGHTHLAGPHILEKCCHDLDLLNWFTDSLPAKVAGFGDLRVFTPDNAPLLDKYGADAFMSWEDPHRTQDPFRAPKDIMDTHVAIMNFRNGVKVQFQATCCNRLPERRMYFSCTEGNMIIDAEGVHWSVIGGPVNTVNYCGDGHGGGDQVMMKEIFACMVNGTAPVCGGDEGLNSAVAALAIQRAIDTEQIVDLAPVWHSLGR